MFGDIIFGQFVFGSYDADDSTPVQTVYLGAIMMPSALNVPMPDLSVSDVTQQTAVVDMAVERTVSSIVHQTEVIDSATIRTVEDA